MTKVLYTLNASCRQPTQHFAISQSKVPQNDLMSSLTTGHYTSPQNRFLYSCDKLQGVPFKSGDSLKQYYSTTKRLAAKNKDSFGIVRNRAIEYDFR